MLITPRSASASQVLPVFDEQLQSGFSDHSWAVRDLTQTSWVRSGTRAISMQPSRKGGLYFYKSRVVQVRDYNTLEFWVNGGTSGGQALNLIIQSGGRAVASRPLADLLPEGRLLGGQWQKVSLDLAALSLPNGVFDGILLQDSTNLVQPPLYLDDMVLRYTGQLTALKLSTQQLALRTGTTASLQASALHADGRALVVTTQVRWVSTHPAVASVHLGNVTASAVGSTVIQATYEGFTATVLVDVTSSVPGPPPVARPLYEDALGAGWVDVSWAPRDLGATDVVHSGQKAIHLDPSSFGGLCLHKKDGPLRTDSYDVLEFWVHGGATGGQQVELALLSKGQTVITLPLEQLLRGEALPAGAWRQVSVRLPELNLPGGLFDGIQLRGSLASAQARLYVDDIRLWGRPPPGSTLVDIGLSQYGMILQPNDTASFRLTASYDDGSSHDRTGQAVWVSGNTSVLAVQGGRVTALGPGMASVSATLGGFTVSGWVQVTETTPALVYGDALVNGFFNHSWGTHALASTQQVHSGSHSISFLVKGYEGLWFRAAASLETAVHYGVRFALHGGDSGGQRLKLLLVKDGSPVGEVLLAPLPAGTWTTVTARLADMGVVDTHFDGLVVQAWGEHNQGTVFLDDITLLRKVSPGQLPLPVLPRVQVAVDVTAERRPLSPGIFGVNFEDMPTPGYSQLAFPLKRWGGNSMTRYNWELDAVNRAADWYFLNVPYSGSDPARLPEGSLADRFISQSLARGTRVLLQVPTIGWAPKDREARWSFSVAKYGGQAGNECDWGTSYHCDAGNGLLPVTRAYLGGNDPEDTSRRVDPEFIGRWVDHLRARFGPDAVLDYALDNEPALWPHTHRDVHPQLTTYDEVWAYTRAYAALLKARDPRARIYGPVSWGWCEYFHSAKDGCAPGPDMLAHGGKPFLEWYLGKVREHQQATGVRLVDYLDIHYYPAERGLAFTSDESAETSRRRLLALRSLYDRTYRDPTSWIQTPVYLLPRMRDLIARNAPGTKLAITEYNFGDGGGISSGLAQAEALSLFAREGVDVATRWGALLAGTPLEDAFRLYLNYDGQGGRISGDSVRALSSNIDAVGAYAFQAADGRRFLLLFNKDIAPRVVDVAAGSLEAGSANVYRFDARQRLFRAPALQVPSGAFSLTLPARSATLLVR